jgi:hypothetical protein
MNTNNETLAVTDGRIGKKLESLPEEKRQLILELASHMRLYDLVVVLKEHGVDTSEASLSRFLRGQKERQVLEDGEEMKDAVEALATRGRGESLKKGSIEALRQRLYEQAMTTQDPEKARELYQDFLEEEAKGKELELEQRKTAAMEEQVKLQRLRIEVQARAIDVRGRAKVVVESAPVARGELPGPTEREFMEGEELPQKIVTAEAGQAKIIKENGAREERADERFAALWERMGKILNRGGRPEEKVLEAREVWEEGRRRLTTEGTENTEE